MTGDDLSITPSPTRAEAAAIAAAIRAHTATDRGETGDGDWSGRRWGVAARLEAVGADPGRRLPTDPWRAATGFDPPADRPGG